MCARLTSCRTFGLRQLQDRRDLVVRVVEGLPQYVRGALVGDSFSRTCSSASSSASARSAPSAGSLRSVDRVGQPRADVGLAPDPGRLGGVDREPGGRGGEEGGRFDHLGPVVALPADPDLLDDVLGLGGAAEHPVGDAEEPRPDTREDCGRLVEIAGHSSIVRSSAAAAVSNSSVVGWSK